MKTSLLIILTFLSSVTFSQNESLPINENGNYEVKQIIKLDGTTENLYSASLIAMTDIFKDSQEVIEYKNKEEGIIIGKLIVKTVHSRMGPKNHYFTFKIKLAFKENKYKIEINHFGHKAVWTSARNECSCVNDISSESCGTGMCIGKKEWKIQKTKAHDKLLIVVESLKKSIQVNIESLSGNNDDW